MVAAAIPGPGVAGRTEEMPGVPPGAARAAGGVTVGVEEEFVLLGPRHRCRCAGRPGSGANA